MFLRFFFFFILTICASFNGFAQESLIEKLENNLESRFGIEKIETLNRLVLLTIQTDPKAGYRFAKRSADLSDNLIRSNQAANITDIQPLVNAYYNLAIADYNATDYIDSKYGFQKIIELNNIGNLGFHKKSTEQFLDSIQYRIDIGEIKENKFFNRLNNLKIGKGIKDISKNIEISSIINTAENKEKNKNFGGAIDSYKNAINLLKDLGDSKTIAELQIKISDLLSQLNQNQEAQIFLEQAIIEKEQEPEFTPISNISNDRDRIKIIADSFANAKDFKNSGKYYRLFNQLSEKVIEDSIQVDLAKEKRLQEILLLKQQKRIAELNANSSKIEKEKQVRLRNTLFVIAVLILIIAILIYFFLVQKKKEHLKLNTTYEDLKITKEELENAEQKITNLLKQQVSGDIANQLIGGNSNQIAEKHFVCILFLDIRNFTVKAEELSPEELIDFQNSIFSFMIDCIEEMHGNINQLLGDGFMATFGAPLSHGNDCQNAFDASQNILSKLEQKIKTKELPPFRIGIGLHAGNVVTGNVGNDNRKQYSVTGNPVIVASRIEQLNKTYYSQLIISEEVFKNIETKQKFKIESVSLKGRTDKTKIYIVEE
jgi:class 3 adenylate cyclase